MTRHSSPAIDVLLSVSHGTSAANSAIHSAMRMLASMTPAWLLQSGNYLYLRLWCMHAPDFRLQTRLMGSTAIETVTIEGRVAT